MSEIRKILLHVDDSSRIATRVDVARRLAEAFDAHVTVQHAALSFLQRYPLSIDSAMVAVSEVTQADAQARSDAKALFDRTSGGDRRLAWSELSCDAVEFTQQALYHDLAIIGQRDRRDPADGTLPTDFVQNLVVDSGRPVLIVPYTGAVAPRPDRVLVAWKPTRESARAVGAALPWLRRARTVVVACYDDEATATVDRLAAFLWAHGIPEFVRDTAPGANGGVGELLLSRAADHGAELLVMGCYGHSRAREWILGGATRTLLQSMTVPVLMVH